MGPNLGRILSWGRLPCYDINTSISELLLLWLRKILCWSAILSPRFCKP